jgi:hypothetical protein
VSFDCSVSESRSGTTAECSNGVLRLEPVNGRGETTELRFQLDNGSLTEWQPVQITITEGVAKNLGGPDCDCKYLDGTAEPVVVPAAARLPAN